MTFLHHGDDSWDHSYIMEMTLLHHGDDIPASPTSWDGIIIKGSFLHHGDDIATLWDV